MSGVSNSYGQITLGTSPYTQNFNTTTLPIGWTTKVNATTTSAGSNVTPIATNTWASTTGEFRFVASAKAPLTSSSNSTSQNAATDRCLAVKTTGSFGDPGQAFTLQIANTVGLKDFNITFNVQLLSAQERTTNYRVEYALGANPTIWTLIGSTFTDLGINGGTWGSTYMSRSFGNTLDNKNTNVWIRISSLESATGSTGSRCTFGIDDVNLSWAMVASDPLSFSTMPASATQINLSATANTNSDNIVVVSNPTGSFSTPTNGVAAGNAGDSFAGGTIIYRGSAASVTNHTGLTANTSYHYKAFSYDASNNYSSGLIANATTAKIEPANQPTEIRISTIITATSIPLIWTPAAIGSQAPDGYFAKLSTASISDPVDGTDPGAGSSAISSGNAGYKATTGVTFTNATAGTMYNVKIYSYTNSGGLIDFNTNSAATFNVATPPNPVSSASLTATGATSADISWTAANGYDNTNHSTLVFVKATNSITTGSPTNAPSTYIANTVFGSGTAYQNDVVATCVYNGDGTNVSVTGLSANTTYHVLIYTVVDVTNSNSKNAYSYSTTTSGTTSNLPAPTANTASLISATGFTANWSTITGASTGYSFDVSTSETFGLNEGFESPTFPPNNWITTNWTRSTAAGDISTGSGATICSTNTGTLTTPAVSHPSSIIFNLGRASSTIDKTLAIEVSTTSQTTGFTTIYTFDNNNVPINTYNQYIVDLSAYSSYSTVFIRFNRTATTTALWRLDNIVVNDFLNGYDSKAITGETSSSYEITGLSPNTTYYYRVRSTSANSTSANSNIITATTSNTFLVNSTVSASALPVCSTCDVSILSGALLNIDESKTFNAITVEPGGKLTNAIGSTLTAATLNLKSNASATATYLDNGTTQITTANVEQYLTAGRNWYVSSPVHPANINALSTASSIVHWDETIGNWATPGSTLNPMRGYISVATNDSKAITFSGTLNNGEKTIALTRTSGKTKEGFNLVGNPYPSYLNWASSIATAANALTTIWYRTQADGIYEFHTYNATGGIGIPEGVTGIIPPMQGFWVRVNTGGGTLTTNNNMRSHGSGSNPLKVKTSSSTQQKILRLKISNTTKSDETVVYFNPAASDNYDTFDSPKMTNGNAAIPEIFTMAETEKVAINGLSSLTMNKELSLGFSTDETDTFTIRASEVSNFDENTKVILKDKLLNKEQDLSCEESYTFSSNPVTTTSRFSLIFRTAGTVTDINNTENGHDIVIYKNESNQIVVFCPGNISPENSVLVYNSLGQLLTSKQLSGDKTVIQLPSQPGIFIVTAMNGKKCITKKVVIK